MSNTDYATMSDYDLNELAAKAMGWPFSAIWRDGDYYDSDAYPAFGRFSWTKVIEIARSPSDYCRWQPTADANQAMEVAEHLEKTHNLRVAINHWSNGDRWNIWFIDAVTGWKPDPSVDCNGISASFPRAMTIACLKAHVTIERKEQP